MLAALVAAIMSTADSQLLVVSSGIARDLYEQLLRRGRPAAARFSVLLSRLSVAVVILGAACLSWISAESKPGSVFSSVFSYVLLAWSGLGAAFGPPFLLGMFWKGATRAGAVASILAGPIVCILWVALGWKARTGVHEILPAFLVSLVFMVIISLCTRPPEDVEQLMADMR
jgi:Na+/proline symporter